jgi:hypothetical protein
LADCLIERASTIWHPRRGSRQRLPYQTLTCPRREDTVWEMAAANSPQEQSQSSRVRPGLESCGLAAADTASILSRLAAGIPIDAVSREIAQGKLLRKRSPSGRRHVLAAVRQRLIEAPPTLPRSDELSTALHLFAAPLSRSQVLLPYLLARDSGAFDIATRLVLPRFKPGQSLTKPEVVSRLKILLAERHQRSWSSGLLTRWAEGFLSVLRDVGALGRGRMREELLAYSVRPEVFTFHLWGQYECGLRGVALHESPFWRLLLLQPAEARRLVGAAADRGWWKFTSAGGADEIVPVHGSLMEWLGVALG